MIVNASFIDFSPCCCRTSRQTTLLQGDRYAKQGRQSALYSWSNEYDDGKGVLRGEKDQSVHVQSALDCTVLLQQRNTMRVLTGQQHGITETVSGCDADDPGKAPILCRLNTKTCMLIHAISVPNQRVKGSWHVCLQLVRSMYIQETAMLKENGMGSTLSHGKMRMCR
jgi:hypothetical protein